MAKKKQPATSEPAEKTFNPDPPPKPPKPPRTLRDSANGFLMDIQHVLYTRGKRLGDLLAIQKEVENLLNIGHPILNEPVE